MTRLAFVDCETTGLDPGRHEVWELAIIAEGKEYTWQLPVDLTRADPTGLRIGRFYERRRQIAGLARVQSLHRVRWPGDQVWSTVGLPVADTAETVAGLLDGAHIVGAVPSFDAAFLTHWLNDNGQAATWHYHLIDVEALVAGWVSSQCIGQANDGVSRGTVPVVRADDSIHHIDGRPPWNSNELSLAVSVDPGDFDRHTALGDARWAKAIYEAVIVGPHGPPDPKSGGRP